MHKLSPAKAPTLLWGRRRAGLIPYTLNTKLTIGFSPCPNDTFIFDALVNGLIDTARDRHDALLLHVADFIRADERTHVRKGQHILKCMTSLGAQELELRTRELFTECLVNLGAIKSDMDVFTVSREDIEHLVGE